MHAFQDPTDHFGPIAVEILPKKLWCQLSWDDRINHHFNVPSGWGFYIVEGVNWPFVSWFIALAVAAVTLMTVLWSALMDLQEGTGIGQYCIAVLAISLSVFLIRHGTQPIR